MGLQRIVKAKTRSGKKFLERCEPKLKENDKKVMFVKGKHTSNTVTECLKDIYSFKRSTGVMYNRKNDILPFENATSLEFFSLKSDASMFIFGNHSKKRPNNLILGRLFNGEVLDMIELGIDRFRPMADYKTAKIATDTKPCLVFSGEAFDEDIDHQRLKNLLIDVFRGPKAKHIRLSGLEHVLSFTSADSRVYLNSYRIVTKKSGHRTPRVELEETGPAVDFAIRRTKFGSDDLQKRARKQPKIVPNTKMRKNVSVDKLGTKSARIHMERQDMDKLQTRKMKGLKRHLDQKVTDETGKQAKVQEGDAT